MTTEISSGMAHYLGTLYRLGGSERFVTPTAVAQEIEVSTPAAARMFGRLEHHKLVERKAYRGVQLTSAGVREALREVRAHRLSEAFLVTVMQYGWHEAHELADRLAEIGDRQFVDRMEAKAGFPTRCPHGEPIPNRDLVMPEIADRPLTELEAGRHGRISRVRIRDEEKLKYLAEEGLVPGVEFRIVARAPFDGPIRLSIQGRESVLGAEIAEKLYVESH
jgi:DtxR family Mn-dependent transcriptional regulator